MPSCLPHWARPLDGETTIEITLLIAPRVDWDAVSDSRDVAAYIADAVTAFQDAYADVDWNTTDLDYIISIETFAAHHMDVCPAPFLR